MDYVLNSHLVEPIDEAPGFKFHPDLQPLVDQREKTMEALKKLQRTGDDRTLESTTGTKMQATFDNEAYDNFDKEMGKLAQARKDFINSKWGQGFMERMNALRKTEAYVKVE